MGSRSGFNLCITVATTSLILSLAACNYDIRKGGDPTLTPGGEQKIEPQQLNYQTVHDQVLVPACIHCHGTDGNVNLETYNNVKINADKIYQEVCIKKTMPKSRPLTAEQFALMEQWLQAGAPEFSEPNNPPTNPQPVPPPQIPLEPTYKSINANIIQKHCIKCHTPQDEVDLSTHDMLLSQQSDLPDAPIVPGDLDKSVLWQKVKDQNAAKPMPPKKQKDPLNNDELNAIQNWIIQGAPDN